MTPVQWPGTTRPAPAQLVPVSASAVGDEPPVPLPLRLHADAAEELLDRLPPLVRPPRFDARHVRAVEPGALLALAILAATHEVELPALPVPPDALLPPLRVTDAASVAALFEAISGVAFVERLAAWGWRPADARTLASRVGEVARNAVEHAGTPVWVAGWRTGAGGDLRIAVADAGPGIGASLSVRDEEEAVLRAVVHGASRFAEQGRGGGLARVAETVGAWGGRMRLRSVSVVLDGSPPWDSAELRTQLAVLPGVQVELRIPAVRRKYGVRSTEC